MLHLADVFEAFRNMSLDTYGLDPAYYVSSPQLSWDAMLKITGVSIELISDPAMFRMIDSGIRGGVCMISTRFAHANNEEIGDQYERSKAKSWIKGLDANNLYGWAMSQPLPLCDFSWVPEEELKKIKWLEQTENQDFGYIVKVDLRYPPELHEAHSDYPLAPERISVKEEWLSDKQLNIKAQYNLPRSDYTSKLIPNLMDKKEYVVDYRNLKFYLKHGLQLTKVNSAVKYFQSKWMAPYIAVNQAKRSACKTDFEKEFFKLMNNSVFGKTCENQKKRTSIYLVNNKAKFNKLVFKPNFMDAHVYTDSFASVEMQKTKVMINKPFFAGFTILDLAKLHMYRYVPILYYDSFSLKENYCSF